MFCTNRLTMGSTALTRRLFFAFSWSWILVSFQVLPRMRRSFIIVNNILIPSIIFNICIVWLLLTIKFLIYNDFLFLYSYFKIFTNVLINTISSYFQWYIRRKKISYHQRKMIIESIQWSHPSTNILAGPSNSGKTTLISSILEYKNTLFKQANLKTILYFNQEQEILLTVLRTG